MARITAKIANIALPQTVTDLLMVQLPSDEDKRSEPYRRNDGNVSGQNGWQEDAVGRATQQLHVLKRILDPTDWRDRIRLAFLDCV
jgi:hypothetical protein